jgi:hypothetical protein
VLQKPEKLFRSLCRTSPTNRRANSIRPCAWVWKAIDRRRRDDGLGEWFDVLRRPSAALAESHPTEANRIGVLHDLIYESIFVSEIAELEMNLSSGNGPGAPGA